MVVNDWGSSAVLTPEALLSRRCWSSMGSSPWWVCCAARAPRSTRQPRPPSGTCPLKATRTRKRSIAAAASRRLWICSVIRTPPRYRNSWQVRVSFEVCDLYSNTYTPTYQTPTHTTNKSESHLCLILCRSWCQSPRAFPECHLK